ncbi:MAG: substrate-binding domain-containing protein [Planctomycetes bacterium]|nr:substrate-binding domain-containing protein [Planctomycetota bacterium]
MRIRTLSRIIPLLAILALAGCGSDSSAPAPKPAEGESPAPLSGTIVTYGRENNSGTYAYFKEHVLQEEDFDARVQTLPGTAAVINAVSKDPRSIGYGGIAYAKGVRALKVKKDDATPGVEPTIENVVSGAYPISRYLYFYAIGEPGGELARYIAWTVGDDGQKVCEAVGYYPMPVEKRPKVAAGSGGDSRKTVTVKGSDTMVILGQRWAEAYMEKNPGVVIQVTGGGSGTGIAALIDGATDLCQASRPMKPKEREQARAKRGKEVVEIAVAMDGLAVFVHESNPLAEITLARLKAIYTGSAKNWEDAGALPPK